MFDVEKFKEPEKISEFTVPMKWIDTETMKHEGATWHIRSYNSPAARAGKRKRDLAMIEAASIQGVDNIDDFAPSLHFYASLVADWEGMIDSKTNEAIPFSEEMLLLILNHSMYGPHTQNQIDRVAGNTAAFFEASKSKSKSQ